MTIRELPTVLRPLYPLRLDVAKRRRKDRANATLRSREARQTSARIDLKVEKQEGNNICWAAVTQSILKFRGENKSQCEIVQEVLGGIECCSEKLLNKNCDKLMFLDHAFYK